VREVCVLFCRISSKTILTFSCTRSFDSQETASDNQAKVSASQTNLSASHAKASVSRTKAIDSRAKPIAIQKLLLS